MSLTSSIVDGLKARRSIHAVTNESPISDERIEELLSEVTLHTPSAFNTQAARLVVLLKEEHEKLWDIAREVASASVPPEQFENLYKPRIAGFRAGYGTVSHSISEVHGRELTFSQVLFYEDPAPFKAIGEKWPMLKEKFPDCMSFKALSPSAEPVLM